MSTVYLDSPTNSTTFTTCCDVAICDNQRKCPACGEAVEGDNASARWSIAYGPIRHGASYGNPRPNDRRRVRP